ncbi:MAG: ATP-dependent DNA helicase [Lachnospiraceae bacterium]|nr:ATP-dependent DNA helicase [Lachnospiraceae bacterium]
MNNKVSVSVRRLVEFLKRSGSIDRRSGGVKSEDALLMGGTIHRKLQSMGGEGYTSEVPLKESFDFDNYELVIEGRADGIIDGEDGITIDEIKGVYRDVNLMEDSEPVHLAQAKCYAAMYIKNTDLSEINVRMTYCNMDSYEVKFFHYGFTRKEIIFYFDELVREYKKWADFLVEWRFQRNKSAEEIGFPYKYRKGQKELAEQVYKTIYLKKRLFLMAPTGVGKTLSVIFPSVKAMGRQHLEKIFYLTAKNVTGNVAVEAYEAMREKGLKFKSVNIMAREKLCLNEETTCYPDKCPYANGHFDRINEAEFDLLTNYDSWDSNTLLEVAQDYKVCPYELATDMVEFADGVVCDYNYAFDPGVTLGKYFSPDNKIKHVLLVDEAHNLVERGREMYSEELHLFEVANARKKIRRMSKEASVHSRIPSTASAVLQRIVTELTALSAQYGQFARDVELDRLMKHVSRALTLFTEMLDDKKLRFIFEDEDVLNFYFRLSGFSNIYELFDDNYVNYIERNDTGVKIKLLCVNPSKNLMSCVGDSPAVFFSATLLPVKYYIDLISGDMNDYTVYAQSSFDCNKCGRFIVDDVSSLYKKRGPGMYDLIACAIKEIVSQKIGNYMIFFPSYAFMEEVYDVFSDKYAEPELLMLKQEQSMNDKERNEFLMNFNNSRTENTMVGFCILGGVFSEGIDLKEDSLIGALIVGTGLPMVTKERELLKDYFEKSGTNGFDYAYRYPGMNKVLQAAGRVIRTEKDTGVTVFMDNRFTQKGYSSLFPSDWREMCISDSEEIGFEINAFWEGLGAFVRDEEEDDTDDGEKEIKIIGEKRIGEEEG